MLSALTLSNGSDTTQRQMMLQKGGVKIWRPRQLYVGAEKRDYVDLNHRETKPSTDPSQEPTKVAHYHSKRVFLSRGAKL